MLVSQKLYYFASNMKKLLHISFIFLLTVTLIVMGSGVTFRHCSCSGKTTMILSHTSQNEGNSETTKGCMKITSMSLSPTTQMQPIAFDFHAYQPLIAIINDWHILDLMPMIEKHAHCVLPGKGYSPPPKLYLYLIKVLTI